MGDICKVFSFVRIFQRDNSTSGKNIKNFPKSNYVLKEKKKMVFKLLGYQKLLIEFLIAFN